MFRFGREIVSPADREHFGPLLLRACRAAP
jgi:hypothetical protein